MFNLKTDPSQLSSANSGITNLKYDQIVPTRDISGGQFSGAPIVFRFENSGEKWWLPSKSYIRMRCKLTKADGTTPLTVSDDIAPNFGLASNLFQSMDFQIANKVVSRCTDYVAQVDALKKRLHKSKSWMDSIGASTNFWESDFKTRQQQVCSDGRLVTDVVNPPDMTVKNRMMLGFDENGATNKNSMTYDTTTGLVTFAKNGGADLPDVSTIYPAGSYFCVISGQPTENIGNAIPHKVLSSTATTLTIAPSSLGGDVAGGSNITPNFGSNIIWGKVEYSYDDSAVQEARRVSEFELVFQPPMGIFDLKEALPLGQYTLNMNPQVASEVLKRSIESSLGAKTSADFSFEVTSMNFYCATLEGPRVDNLSYLLDLKHTRCQAVDIDNREFGQKNLDVSSSTQQVTIAYQDIRAGSDTRISSSKLRSYNTNVSVPVENTLNRWFFQYAGVSRPSPDYDGELSSGKDFTVQKYVDTQLNSQAYYDVGGTEPIVEFHENGSYYHYQTPKDGSDKSTRLTVSQQFSASTIDIKNTRLLVFDHSSQVARIQIQDSRVVNVELSEA